jgi:FLVCR family feline leukemia virus subgroup C receptor-related protein
MEAQPKDETNLNLLERKQLEQVEPEIRAYKSRWIVLTIFIVYAAVNSYQWVEYSIINNIVMKYYNVSAVTVEWTSIIYMALYAPLVIPASYVLDKKVSTKFCRSDLTFLHLGIARCWFDWWIRNNSRNCH